MKNRIGTNKAYHNLFYLNLSMFLASSDSSFQTVSSNANSTVSLLNMGKLHTMRYIATRMYKRTGAKSKTLAIQAIQKFLLQTKIMD